MKPRALIVFLLLAGLTGQAQTAAMPASSTRSLDELKATLDHDLAPVLTTGALAPASHAGVVIGVLTHGQRRLFTYGPIRPDSVFEIGSITKTFTGLLLAQLTAQGKVHLDDPVRLLLPPGVVAKPSSAREITLLDLSEQHSGLPLTPYNLVIRNPANPHADYDVAKLYSFLGHHGVAWNPATPYAYSNTGVKLLGQALAVRAGEPYPRLLADEVTGPLNLRETLIDLPPALQQRFVQGHDPKGNVVPAWTFADLPGAGALHSTASDMLTWLAAQLHPEHLQLSTPLTPRARTLPAAILATHQLHAAAEPGLHIALNWFRDDASGNYLHGGQTGGFSSYAVFNLEADFAVIVLCNQRESRGGFANTVGDHVAQWLAERSSSVLR